MLKQRPVVYLALIVAFGGLLLAGVPLDRVVSVGFVVFMLMMHLGGHGHAGHGHGGRGRGGQEGHDTRDGQEQRLPSSAPKEDEGAGK